MTHKIAAAGEIRDGDGLAWCRLRAQRLFYSDSSPIIVLPLQLNDWLTNSYWVNLIDVALASENDNSKIVEIVTVAHVDNQKHVDNILVQIWKVIWS